MKCSHTTSNAVRKLPYTKLSSFKIKLFYVNDYVLMRFSTECNFAQQLLCYSLQHLDQVKPFLLVITEILYK